MKDEGYADFHSKLVPTVNRQKIIGVRVPDCRKLAKEMKNSDEVGEFLSSLPHEYYDEDILHALLLTQINDIDECIKAVDDFLPFIDN